MLIAASMASLFYRLRRFLRFVTASASFFPLRGAAFRADASLFGLCSLGVRLRSGWFALHPPFPPEILSPKAR
jgi:hypothetical protein